jgi:hypothetical protein
MKNFKHSIYFAAVIIGTSFFSNKAAATIPIIPMDISERAVVRVFAVPNQTGSVSISDANGNAINIYSLDPGDSSSKLFDFSNVENGLYTFDVESELMNTTTKLKVEDSYIEIIGNDVEYKPVFIVDGNDLKVNYFNTDQEDMQLSIESYGVVFYTEEEGNSLTLQKRFDIRKIKTGGEYYVKLVVGDKTYYHTFFKS